ncbi:zinc ribbon domain-containing protein [Mesorhizobium sp. M0228]|uniref:zinc ribbon domain-containing protein n=1 Tax=Mesorhizobium sp. M0228 TaxID=2956923 RepID=UPI00333BCFE6
MLQGIARCGHCGRRLHTHYRGRKRDSGPPLCRHKVFVEGRGVYCLNIGGLQIDEAVVAAFLEALEPVRRAATLEAARRLEKGS